MNKTVAIILAAGSGSRFAADCNKAYAQIGGQPLITYSLKSFDTSNAITDIVVAIRPEDKPTFMTALEFYKPRKLKKVVFGGATRHESESNALTAAIAANPSTNNILIHDAARPFASHKLIDSLINRCADATGVIPALPISDFLWDTTQIPLQQADTQNFVTVQTPQIFQAGPLLEAFNLAGRPAREKSSAKLNTDTAQTVQNLDQSCVCTVEGDPRNLKVTTPEDRERAEALAQIWNNGSWRK